MAIVKTSSNSLFYSCHLAYTQNEKDMRNKENYYLVLIGLALFISSCKNETSQPVSKEYATLVVKDSSKTLSTSYSATIRGKQDVSIYAEISGKITDIKVTEGQKVKKGQVLFVIDQVPYKAALGVAEANYAAAKVGIASAQLDYDNTKELHDNQVVSDYELQTALNKLHTAETTLAQMEASRINAANNLSYTEIKSPSDGVIGTIPYRQGTLVSSSMSEPLTTVSDNSEMFVYFSINENNLLNMAREYGTLEKALQQMPDIQLKLNDGTIYNQTGRVASISGVINENTGTVSLRAVFPNPDRLLHSGANGSVIIPETYTDIILIPQEATFELQDKVFVYKIVDGMTKSTQITVSSSNDGKEYIVLDGLKSGDEIIASGAGLLKDGIQVKKTNTTSPEK